MSSDADARSAPCSDVNDSVKASVRSAPGPTDAALAALRRTHRCAGHSADSLINPCRDGRFQITD